MLLRQFLLSTVVCHLERLRGSKDQIYVRILHSVLAHKTRGFWKLWAGSFCFCGLLALRSDILTVQRDTGQAKAVLAIKPSVSKRAL